MNVYEQLDNAYHRLCRRAAPAWLHEIGATSLADLVATIRDDHPDPESSDRALQRLLDIARSEPDAVTVALHALAPRLRRSLAHACTSDYRHDALTDLALVLVDSPHCGRRLAARLVNRAHNRSYRASRTQLHGTVNPIVVAPVDPVQLGRIDNHDDPATEATQRVDLARLAIDIDIAIANGALSPRAWAAYREHRLRRAITGGPACDAYQRTTAARVARKLEPLIRRHLAA